LKGECLLKKLLKCKECGHEQPRTNKNIYTGVDFNTTFVYVCGECRGDMYEIPYEPGTYLTECEKVRALHGDI
jgi:hypothetical protein